MGRVAGGSSCGVENKERVIRRVQAMVSIYNSGSCDMSDDLLSTLFQRLPEPVVLTGDFSSYVQIWGGPVNDNRGDGVLGFVDENPLNILGDRRHTRTSGT